MTQAEKIRAFAEGLMAGLLCAPAPASAASSGPGAPRRRRRAPPPPTQSRQLSFDSLGVPAGDTPPVAEFDPPVVPATQAELERMERILRGEVPPDTYNPDGVENRMAHLT